MNGMEIWISNCFVFRYNCYFSASRSNTDKHSIGVATSSSPWGPFTDSGRPIVEDNWNCVACYIDPTYFRDPKTGKHYLIWKGDRLVHTHTHNHTIHIYTVSTVALFFFQLPIGFSVIHIQELDKDGLSFKKGSQSKDILWTDRWKTPVVSL